MPGMMQYCDVMLGDGDTINTYFNIKGADYQEVSRNTMAAFPNLKYLAMTARKAFHATHNTCKGLLYDGKNFFESKEYDIPDIADRIGAGDAFMGGLIRGLIQKQTSFLSEMQAQYCIEFATAAGVYKHSIHGDFNLTNVKEIEGLMGGDTGGKVKR